MKVEKNKTGGMIIWLEDGISQIILSKVMLKEIFEKLMEES